MKKNIVIKSSIWVAFILFFGSFAYQVYAILPPLRNIQLTSQNSGSSIQYTFSVFDEQRGQTMSANTGFQTSISTPVIQDGVVAFVINTGSGNIPNRTIYFSVYDPKLGSWRTASSPLDVGNFHYAGGLALKNGMVKWTMNNGTGNPGGADVEFGFAVYDPQAGSWKIRSVTTYTSSTVYTVSTPILSDGVIVWVRGVNNGSTANITINAFAYDASRGGWIQGLKDHYLSFGVLYQIDSVSNGTVYYRVGSDNYTFGYNGDSGIWGQIVGVPRAYFVPSQSSGNAPLKNYFWDMSVGGTSWNYNFGDGGSSGSQTPFYTYNSAINSPFTATQTVSGPGGTRSHSRTITITTPHSISGRLANISNFGIGGATVFLSGPVSRTAQTDSNGNYSFTNLTSGYYTVTVSKNGYTFTPPVITFSNLNGAQTGNFTGKLNKKVSDFDGDGKTDASIFRPANNQWWFFNSSTNSSSSVTFGLSTDKISPRDFDGDGKTDIAVFRPSNGTWYTLRSSDSTYANVQFGSDGDIPVSGDYDGDDKSDFAVFRPSSNIWYVLRSSNNQFFGVQFGFSTDKLIPMDYDADGKTDIAVYRPDNSAWYILNSSDSTFRSESFGENGDSPVAGDYDGDGKADLATYRPSDYVWRIKRSSDSVTTLTYFGYPDDQHTPGDYDGDGKQDIGVFRPSTGMWYAIQSSNQGLYVNGFGQSGDLATPKSYLPE